MAKQKTVEAKFRISAAVEYLPEESTPEKSHFLFAYQISITNEGTSTAQLMNRHWIITDANGRTEEVRGMGVVGLQPKINPGHSFSYESACPLPTPSGSMYGSYHFVDEQGDSFNVSIPEFYLIAPNALH